MLGLGLGSSWLGWVSWSERDGDGASVLQAVHRLRPIHRINTNLSLSLSLSLSLVSRESSITRNTYNYFDWVRVLARRGEASESRYAHRRTNGVPTERPDVRSMGQVLRQWTATMLE